MAAKKGRLVVVEDDHDIATAVVMYARQLGYDVEHANNGKAGYDAVVKNPPDVLLLDVNMPIMDGRDVLAKLKGTDAIKNTVVLFASGRDEQSDRLVGLDLGADDYETKPYHLETLFHKIERLVQKKRGIAP